MLVWEWLEECKWDQWNEFKYKVIQVPAYSSIISRNLTHTTSSINGSLEHKKDQAQFMFADKLHAGKHHYIPRTSKHNHMGIVEWQQEWFHLLRLHAFLR